MKRNLSLVLALGLMLNLLVTLQPVSALSISSATFRLGCTSFDYEFDWMLDRDNTGTGNEAYYMVIVDGAGKTLLNFNNSAPVGLVEVAGAKNAPYSTLPDYNPLTMRIGSNAGNGLSEQIVVHVTGSCAGLPTYDGPATVLGPDMVELPAQAVVGKFVANTTLLFAPDAAATSDTVLEIGTTLWVLGVDSTGQFYQVLMSGNTAWVPVSSMGPNYDDVWNGTPLPTTVVN